MNGNRWRSNSNDYPHIFDHGRRSLNMALPTRSDIGSSDAGHETGSGNRKWKPEVEMTFERKQMAMRFQRLPHIFDHVQSEYDTAPTSDGPDIGNSKRSESLCHLFSFKRYLYFRFPLPVSWPTKWTCTCEC